MKIDVVIPNYNGSDLVKRNLPILLKFLGKYDLGQIIIIDDFSKTDDYEKLEDFINKTSRNSENKIKLSRNKKNLGFSSTVNNGVDECRSELVLLLNTDIAVEENFLDAAIEDMSKNINLYGVGLMDKSIEDGKAVLRGRGIGRWSRGFLVHKRGDVNHKDTFWISGGSCLIRRDIYEKFGGFDPIYNPFYWEDIDLSYRVRKAGYEILFEPKSSVIHYHSLGAIKKSYNSSKIASIAYRNQFIFIWKNITDPNLLISHVAWLPYHLIKAALRFDMPFFEGLLNAFFRIPRILSSRSEQKQLNKKKDRDLISQ